MYRLLSISFLLMGLTLIGVAAFDYFTPADAPGVFVEQPERELSDVVAGQPITVTYSIHNPTQHRVQVVGLTGC